MHEAKTSYLITLAPPTAVRNPTVVQRNESAITVQWERPANVGREDDYYYVVEYSKDVGVVITSIGDLRDTGNTVTHIIEGLNPGTNYVILVSVHNGISDQDIENADRRRVQISAATKEGSKFDCWNFSICMLICVPSTWQQPQTRMWYIQHIM